MDGWGGELKRLSWMSGFDVVDANLALGYSE